MKVTENAFEFIVILIVDVVVRMELLAVIV